MSGRAAAARPKFPLVWASHYVNLCVYCSFADSFAKNVLLSASRMLYRYLRDGTPSSVGASRDQGLNPQERGRRQHTPRHRSAHPSA